MDLVDGCPLSPQVLYRFRDTVLAVSYGRRRRKKAVGVNLALKRVESILGSDFSSFHFEVQVGCRRDVVLGKYGLQTQSKATPVNHFIILLYRK